jgi:hypothetical protein
MFGVLDLNFSSLVSVGTICSIQGQTVSMSGFELLQHCRPTYHRRSCHTRRRKLTLVTVLNQNTALDTECVRLRSAPILSHVSHRTSLASGTTEVQRRRDWVFHRTERCFRSASALCGCLCRQLFLEIREPTKKREKWVNVRVNRRLDAPSWVSKQPPQRKRHWTIYPP